MLPPARFHRITVAQYHSDSLQQDDQFNRLLYVLIQWTVVKNDWPKMCAKNMDEANDFDFDAVVFVMFRTLMLSGPHTFSHVPVKFDGFTCYLCHIIPRKCTTQNCDDWNVCVWGLCGSEVRFTGHESCRTKHGTLVCWPNRCLQTIWMFSKWKHSAHYCAHCWIHICVCIVYGCFDSNSGRIHFSISSYVIFASIRTFILHSLFSSISRFAIHFCANNYQHFVT